MIPNDGPRGKLPPDRGCPAAGGQLTAARKLHRVLGSLVIAGRLRLLAELDQGIATIGLCDRNQGLLIAHHPHRTLIPVIIDDPKDFIPHRRCSMDPNINSIDRFRSATTSDHHCRARPRPESRLTAPGNSNSDYNEDRQKQDTLHKSSDTQETGKINQIPPAKIGIKNGIKTLSRLFSGTYTLVNLHLERLKVSCSTD